MVGSAQVRLPMDAKELSLNVVFKLNYPNSSVIGSSMVSGRLESLDPEGSDVYFKPILVLGFSRMNYEYSLIKDEIKSIHADESRASIYNSKSDCLNFVSLSDQLEFEYGASCDGSNCSLLDQLFGYLPKFMSMNVIECSSDKFVRFFFGFSNSGRIHNGFLQPFDPGNTLIAEGVWNENRNQLRFVACSILMNSSGKTSVGDCSTRLNLTIASVFSIRSRSPVFGQIWSNKSVVDVGYYDKIEIRTSNHRIQVLPGLRYEYTEIERAKRYCSGNNATKTKGARYPDPYSTDMKFDMVVRNDKKQNTWGVVIPIFANGHFLQQYPTLQHLGTLNDYGSLVNHTYGDFVNMSYSVILKPMNDGFEVGVKTSSKEMIYISAEGTYNTNTGLLCMVGCWSREAHGEKLFNTSAYVDCEIIIKIQFPHWTAGVMPKGTIESMRQRMDPLYFEQLSLMATSITVRQADRSIWRMDLEIAMVLISNSLACVFLGLQLLHVKNSPQVLAYVSVVMLLVLTIGHMVPLLLNFDALLSNHRRQNVFLGTGDWLEINEIVVRAITMITFLLEARLLQLTWSSRNGNGSRNDLWATEKKILYLSLPLCLFGALVALLLHPLKPSVRRLRYQRVSRWRDLKAYAGLILDAFLFPQIIFNILCGSKENALALPYYFGTTVVRLLPHAYDLFRAHSSALKLDLWYIYANPRMNFYSTSWDIVICCCGLLFAVVIYLQQRFGGGCVLPLRLRERYPYEKVPIAVADSK